MVLGRIVIFHFVKRCGQFGANALQLRLLRQHFAIDPHRLFRLTAPPQNGCLEEAGALLGELTGERIFLHRLFEFVQLQVCNQARVVLELPAFVFGPRRLIGAVLLGAF